VNELQISIEESGSEAERQFVVQGLVGYNSAQATPAAHRDLTLFARHNREVVGGLIGHTHWNWLFVKQLWVADSFRRRGLGRSLMRAAEQAARSRGCLHAHCDTFDFQALPFYQKLGYHIFGQLEDYPVGHTRFFLHKRTLDETGIN
jgi:GNAT superfamily N-acetyltransferase